MITFVQLILKFVVFQVLINTIINIFPSKKKKKKKKESAIMSTSNILPRNTPFQCKLSFFFVLYFTRKTCSPELGVLTASVQNVQKEP